MANSNEVIDTAIPFGAEFQGTNLFSPLLFDSGRLQISDENRVRVRFAPKSVVADPDTLGSLTINESGRWEYSVYHIKTQFLALGERKVELFSLTSTKGESLIMTLVLIGSSGGALIDDLGTKVCFV
ncbi:VCBS domain-containing protein [Vibrio sp. M260118]|uniref:VCBS domain-containing protein n=1 Tax=Vibrio sp. M260118 TaxID=3020896 RepID=UPI002F422A3B